MGLPSGNGPLRWQGAVLGIASIVFGMIMREVANRRRAEQSTQPATPLPATPLPAKPTPPPPPDPPEQEPPKTTVHTVPVLPSRPRKQADAVADSAVQHPLLRLIPSNRPVTWRRWTVYLFARLCLATFTMMVLEAASQTNSSGFRYLALVPTIGALLIPYGRPRQHHRPAPGTGAATWCVALVAVLAWPWYFYATGASEQTPVAIISTQTFTVSAGSDGSCLVLTDDKQNHWYTAHSLISAVRSDRVTLYQTTFGWTPDSHPTRSVSAFLREPRLVQFAYTISRYTADSCLSYSPSGGGGY